MVVDGQDTDDNGHGVDTHILVVLKEGRGYECEGEDEPCEDGPWNAEWAAEVALDVREGRAHLIEGHQLSKVGDE